MNRSLLLPLLSLAACTPEPPLHLYEEAEVELRWPVVDLSVGVLWNYELIYGEVYNWQEEWFYGWDDIDRQIFGEVGYTEPHDFNLRRYNTGSTPYAPHISVQRDNINGTSYQGRFSWGFWDLLVWNNITTLDGVQSLHFDEETTLDRVTAYTNQSMQVSRYQAPRYLHSFYEPEPLFAGYEQAIEINERLDGFEFDPVRNVYVRSLNMYLQPVTYIYLTQVILHNNRGRITAVDGNANLSGMAHSVELNTGVAGEDPITVYYNVRLKTGLDMRGETVDIVGGRLLTFGICGNNGSRISRADELVDRDRHYMDVTMQFNNGIDSTFVFDVTQQVRYRYKGGVITVELDVDSISIPTRSGGSGFDAVVLDPDSVTHVIEM